MLKEQLLKNKERLENEGRLKISSYHVLSTLPRLALSHRKVVYYFTASQLRLAYIRKFL